MASWVYVDVDDVTDNAPDESAVIRLAPRCKSDRAFLVLTPEDAAVVRAVIRNPSRCGVCLGAAKIDAPGRYVGTCGHCAGTGLGPEARKVSEMLQ